ncbi:cilia- and flagella-associated protein 99 [Octopus sinensis]|uniref:Cilia- and flagella-associated protein 99 n=1 Tax=Octopus sinensis TaxID=2607531 RepID=A0A6P7T5G2_9MOLL|nr:cilia- and flagella-associated protein 99 [Octopus sinensis]
MATSQSTVLEEDATQFLDHCISLLGTYDANSKDIEAHIYEYLQQVKIEDTTYIRIFKECMCGCIRYWNMINLILESLFTLSIELSQIEENIFIILTYIYIFKLKQFTLTFFLEILDSLDPIHVSKYLEFLTSRDQIIIQITKVCRPFYDDKFLKNKVMKPLLDNLPLLSDYNNMIQMKLQSSLPQKPRKEITNTVIKPFNLTKPAFRKVPLPQPIPKLGKAKPVPKTLYEEPSEFKTLYSLKKNNKALAEEHLKELANLELNCADPTLKEKTYLKLREIENERNKLLQFNKKKCISLPKFETPTPIKMTKAAVLREGKVHLKEEEAELKWLEELEKGGKEDRQFVKWQNTMKEQDMKQSMLELEKLRLKSKIIREDAILAKEKLQEENRRTVLQLKQETEEMLQDYLQQQLEEEQQSKKVVQEVAESQKTVKDAKKKVHEQKKKIVQDVQRGKQELNAAALENATIEMEKRLEIIDRIRVLTATQQYHNTKLFDTTETSGLGLLSEMSLAELQERLAVMKRWEQEDQEKKRYEILLSKQASQELVSDTLDVILKHRNEKSQMTSLRRQKQKEAIKEDSHSKIFDDEINVLQRLLEEKRSRRLKCMQPSSKQNSRKSSPHKQTGKYMEQEDSCKEKVIKDIHVTFYPTAREQSR